MVNPRTKGNSFELQIAKELSYTLFPYLKEKNLSGSDLPFRRRPLSGGFDNSMTEDIWFNPKNEHLSEEDKKFVWPMAVECKFYKEYNIESLIINREKSIIKQWWDQTVNEAKLTNKLPLLIFKKNDYAPMYMAEWGGLNLPKNGIILELDQWYVEIDTFERLKPKLVNLKNSQLNHKICGVDAEFDEWNVGINKFVENNKDNLQKALDDFGKFEPTKEDILAAIRDAKKFR